RAAAAAGVHVQRGGVDDEAVAGGEAGAGGEVRQVAADVELEAVDDVRRARGDRHRLAAQRPARVGEGDQRGDAVDAAGGAQLDLRLVRAGAGVAVVVHLDRDQGAGRDR